MWKFILILILGFFLYLAYVFIKHYGHSSFDNVDFSTAKIEGEVLNDNGEISIRTYVNGQRYIGLSVMPDIKPYQKFRNEAEAQIIVDEFVRQLKSGKRNASFSKKKYAELGINIGE